MLKKKTQQKPQNKQTVLSLPCSVIPQILELLAFPDVDFLELLWVQF